MNAAMRSFGRWLYRWLLESELPVALQVVWKLLTLGMTGLLIYLVPTTPHLPTFGAVTMGVLAFCFLVMGLFGKLGDG